MNLILSKGFDFSDNETKIFIDEQRIRYCMEFVNSFTRNRPYGVLFSGPNGVGKSSICLLTYLMCYIRSIPVAYIPMSQQWVGFSKTEDEAREYFMKTFLKQNADLIVNDPSLFPHFKSLIEPSEAGNRKFDPKSYVNFCQDVGKGVVRKCGFIADEVQTLTAEAFSDPSKGFFAKDFTIWTNFSGKLNSQLCASAYGLREFSLPSGEDPRLKFIHPFPLISVKPLLKNIESPFHMRNATDDLVDKIVDYFGGIPRSLWELSDKMKISKDEKHSIEIFNSHKLTARHHMTDIFMKKFWNKSTEKEWLLTITLNILKKKEFFQSRSKELYDYGLCYISSSGCIVPINRCAEIVLHEVYASYLFELDKKLSDIKRGAERGFLFEDYVNAAIILNKALDPLSAIPMMLKFKDRLNVYLTADQVSYFDKETEISIKDYRSQWISTVDTFVCDGIIIPSKNEFSQDPNTPIIIYDQSVTNPFKRKTDKLANLTAFRVKIEETFKKTVIVVLCFDKDIEGLIDKQTEYPNFYILDKAELKYLRIPF